MTPSSEPPGADPYAVDWGGRAGHLREAAGLEQTWYRGLAAGLVPIGGRVAMDVGCGGGGMARALARVVGEGGVVVAADASPEVLAEAGALLAGVSARVELVLADLGEGVEPLRGHGPADLVWTSAAVHHVGDQQAAVTALAGLLAPGGRLALAEGGLPARRLPWDVGIGEPGLEVRLEAAQDRWFARMRAGLPGSVPMPYGWTEALRRAGLSAVTSQSALLERPVPLAGEDVERVVAKLTHRVDWLRPADLLSTEDLAAWDRLLDPSDGAYLGRRSDLSWLEVRTVHTGRRP
jgi:SAM-dependent methyltransferase